jgi:hypothetical protein
MKRSEMELNIATNIVITKPYIDFKEAQALAKIALISVLENGMFPPPSNFNIHTVDKQLGFVAEVTYDFPINEDNSVNLWETEDE